MSSKLSAPVCALSVGVAALTGIRETDAAGSTGSEPPSQPQAGQAAEKPQDAGEAKLEELQRAVQNPVADLISVPFQNNLNFAIGPYDRTADILNVQPVIPIELTDDWNVVTRTILPIALGVPDVTQQAGDAFGLGDLVETAFLAPSHPKGLIWGLGPAFQFPTATSSDLGTGKWSVGPAAVVLVQPKPWTFGAIAWNVWSVIGPSDRAAVDLLTLQYFINYNLPKGFYLTSDPILTANWKGGSAGNIWTVPFGGGVGAIVLVDKLPINLQLSAYYNVWRPDVPPSPSWQTRIQMALLFPKQ